MSEIDKSLWPSIDEHLAGYWRLKDGVRGLPDPSAQSVAPKYSLDAYRKDALHGGAGISGKTWSLVKDMTRHIYAKTDEALAELLASGVAAERIARFTQQGTNDTGLSVDDVPVWWSRVEYKGHTILVCFEWEETPQLPPTPPE